jgi:NifU-like protein involved in Fe-S cluster formation
MSDAEYNELVVDHFERPRNVGTLISAGNVIQGKAGRRDQGAEFVLTARVADERIADARFEAYGCPHCIAAGSLLTTSLIGSDQERIRQWSWRELAQQLQVPTAKRGRLLILEDAVRAMAADWRRLGS